jgi:predicted phosphodiesterase
MRTVAVCSDVHSNIEALEAMLDHARERGVDEVWCLGDLVGNAHDPVACLDLVRASCSIVLAGNHDLIAADVIGPRDPARRADAAMLHSRAELARAGGDRVEWLVSLPSEQRIGPVVLAQGCPAPFDPVRDYLGECVSVEEVTDSLDAGTTALVGHTHRAGSWVDGSPVVSTRFEVSSSARTVVNVGAVGDVRRPHAEWLELTLDVDGGPTCVTHHVCEYDRTDALARLTALGLPAG